MSYEAWGDDDHLPDCPHCEQSRTEQKDLERVLDDLSMLTRLLVRQSVRAAPDNNLAKRAMAYLEKEHLLGSPLRDAAKPQPDQPAQEDK